MKKIFSVIALTLALNFLALAGGVGWLVGTKKIDGEKINAIREIVFPKEAPASDPTTQPVVDATPQPSTVKLEELLAQKSGRNATEQVEFIQRTFDGQLQTLERRQRELLDLQRRIDLARDQLAKDRKSQDAREKSFETRAEEQEKLLTDEGFQASLLLYNTMPAKQVKSVFLGLEDDTVMRYLQAMQPRTASKIIKEFKTPEELARIATVLERIRLASADAGALTDPNAQSSASPDSIGGR